MQPRTYSAIDTSSSADFFRSQSLSRSVKRIETGLSRLPLILSFSLEPVLTAVRPNICRSNIVCYPRTPRSRPPAAGTRPRIAWTRSGALWRRQAPRRARPDVSRARKEFQGRSWACPRTRATFFSVAGIFLCRKYFLARRNLRNRDLRGEGPLRSDRTSIKCAKKERILKVMAGPPGERGEVVVTGTAPAGPGVAPTGGCPARRNSGWRLRQV